MYFVPVPVFLLKQKWAQKSKSTPAMKNLASDRDCIVTNEISYIGIASDGADAVVAP